MDTINPAASSGSGDKHQGSGAFLAEFLDLTHSLILSSKGTIEYTSSSRGTVELPFSLESSVYLPSKSIPLTPSPQLELVRLARISLQRQGLDVQIDWHPGSFDETFPELSHVAQDYGQLEFEGLQKHIAREAQRAEMTLLWGRIPVPQTFLKSYGAWIIAAIQFLYIVLLSQLAKQPNHGQADGACPATFSGVLGTLFHFACAVLLPIGVALAIAMQGGHSIFTSGAWNIAVIVLCCILSIATVLLTRRLRQTSGER